MPRLRPAHTAILTGLLPALVCCLGCGGDKTYRVSGKVTFKGQPIAVGKIYFLPDGKKGNKGPGGYADIKDGNYDTSLPGGSGAVGGAMLIRIDAVEPGLHPSKSGESVTKVLFPTYQISADLPASDSTKDIDVPADAVKGQKKGDAKIP